MSSTPTRTAAADRLRAFIREHRPGGCKWLSKGPDACECPLCDVDRLMAALRAAPSPGAGETLTQTLEQAIESVLNRHSAENFSNTPDFILARFLINCLDAWNTGVSRRAEWYGRMDRPGQSTQPPAVAASPASPVDTPASIRELAAIIGIGALSQAIEGNRERLKQAHDALRRYADLLESPLRLADAARAIVFAAPSPAAGETAETRDPIVMAADAMRVCCRAMARGCRCLTLADELAFDKRFEVGRRRAQRQEESSHA